MWNQPPWRRQADRLSDLAVVAGAIAPGLLLQASTDPRRSAWAALIVADAVIAAGLLRRQRSPILVLWVSFAVLIAAYLVSEIGGARLAPLAVLPLAICLYGLGNLSTGWEQQLLALVGTAVLIGGGLAVNLAVSSPSHRAGLDVIAVLTAMPMAWVSGLLARRQRLQAIAAQRRIDAVLRDQVDSEARAAQMERLRIAREMHDVVAHALTLTVLRAETIRARQIELPTWVNAEVDGIATASRQAGNELHDVLRALRSRDDDPVDGARGAADFEALLLSARAVGTEIDTNIDIAFGSLPRHVQLGAFRIVQESLTNVRRHAPGARVTVVAAIVDAALALEVRNTRGATIPRPGDGGGFGLLSMRERVQTFGGTFTAGTSETGGFEVIARIPLDTHMPLEAQSRHAS